MGSRIALHNELLKFYKDVYFQPPSGKQMKYPCIVYAKSDKSREFGNNALYLSRQQYQITVIEHDPDSEIADNMEKYFTNCAITQYYTVDNLNHTTLNLYY